MRFAVELSSKQVETGKRIPVHIEVDTGMGRGGAIAGDAIALVKDIFELPNMEVEGIFSHLAVSEAADDPYNARQWRIFSDILTGLEKEGISIPLRHISNSGGLLDFPAFNQDMVRPGIMTYGVYPGPATTTKANLIPVMTFKTTVLILKDFPANLKVLAACTPVYESMPGWAEDISGILRFEDLPENAIQYVKRIEALAETPAKILSVGPGREQTMILTNDLA